VQYREHGKTGKQVSALGYGAMRLPFDDPEESVALLQLGMDLGINYIDSAYGYGARARARHGRGDHGAGRWGAPWDGFGGSPVHASGQGHNTCAGASLCALQSRGDYRVLWDEHARASARELRRGRRERSLSAQEVFAIRVALAENERLSELYCTGCGYCLPCPEGVAIPDIFSAMDLYRVWGLTGPVRERYGRLGPDNRRGKMNASTCIECGQCEEKCPQHISIREQLKETHEVLGEQE
jgi:predicted aldo/keto reductase-like oxidoreductase